MHVFRDAASIRSAALVVPSLSERLTWFVEEVSEGTSTELDQLLTIVVAERGDDLDSLSESVGFDVRDEGVENLTVLPGWFELTFIVSGEGFGYIVYVPDAPDTAPDLLAFCRSQLPQVTPTADKETGHQRVFDVQSGAVLDLSRYYGFGDAGSIAGSFDGYESAREAICGIREQYPTEAMSTDPTQLGEVEICVISGRQYVNRLREMRAHDEGE